MEPFVTITGVAAPLAMADVDTDMIVPKQFLKTTARTGLARALFHDLRARGGFVLDRPEYAGARILVAGANFGCGSSREHAVWALLDAGFRVVIAPSFADIFFGNCFRNGMLAVTLPQGQVEALMGDAGLTVDLAAQTVLRPDGELLRFEIDPSLKERLIAGSDDIALTLRHEDDIAAFETSRKRQMPWA